MADKAELGVRFERVLSALRNIIATEAALDPAWEESKKGVEGAFADSLFSRSQARRALEDETPTMDTLIISLKDNHYKDPSWPNDGSNDAQTLRTVWHAVHDIIAAGKRFTADDLTVISNLYSALERAREKLASNGTPDDAPKPSWDRITGVLSFNDEAVRTIRRIGVAKNVVLVLDAFQEEGWPVRIDSPLSPEDSQRHHATIDSLNKGLSRIRFRSDGEGKGFIWEIL
jgi:hypothetical protein